VTATEGADDLGALVDRYAAREIGADAFIQELVARPKPAPPELPHGAIRRLGRL
jgi:hypothetical protein